MIKITVDELIKLTKEDLKGKVVVFPTDTVYGIGAIYTDPKGIEKIYELKHRNKAKPLACLAGAKEDILPYIKVNNLRTVEFMSFWPGALTLVFEKAKYINVDQDINTIAFRIPNSNIALKILKHFGIMAVTSMNISGSEPLNDISSIETNFKEEIDYLVIDEECPSKVSSTILDISTEKTIVLRSGELLSKLNV